MPVQQGSPSQAKAAARPKPAKPAAPTTDYAALLRAGLAPPDYSGLAQTANKMAGQAVGAQVAGIRAAQQQIRQDAAAQAAQVTQASIAASKYLQSLGLGNAVAGDYANAAEAQRAAAAGYSGGLQQTVGDAAYQVQQNLAGLGSTQQAAPNVAATGNVLYGLGGNLPASQLDVQGPLQAAQARALPAQTLGYGQQIATGVLGAGAQEAGRMNADVLAAEAKRATLAAQYLSDLEKAARDAGQDRIANTLSVLKLQQADAAQQATAQYRQDQLDFKTWQERQQNLRSQAGLDFRTWQEQQQNARYAAGLDAQNNRFAIGEANDRQALDARLAATYAGINAANQRNADDNARLAQQAQLENAPRISTAVSNLNRYYSDQFGNPLVTDKQGRPVPTPGNHWKNGRIVPDKKPGGKNASGLTAKDKREYKGRAFTIATTAFNGGLDKNGNELPQLDYSQVALEYMKTDIPVSIWKPVLDQVYAGAYDRGFPSPYRGYDDVRGGPKAPSTTTPARALPPLPPNLPSWVKRTTG